MPSQQDAHTSFRYLPLSPDCIRLLQLLPAGPGSELQLKLINNVSRIKNEVKYTALSYCWGDPNDTLPVIVDGHLWNVTRNLHDALVAIVKHHADSVDAYLWIDSICINQIDDEEKSKQVARMWRTFRDAHLVFAWLGPEDQSCKKIFDALHEIEQQVGEALENRREMVPYNQDYLIAAQGAETVKRSRSAVLEAEQQLLDGLSPGQMLLRRTYFSRVWMIVECVQASELVFACGKHSCAYKDLEFYLIQAPNTNFQTVAPIQARSWNESNVQHSEGFQGPPELEQMWDCLFIFSEAQCSDYRDRVYAMLGHPFIRKLDPQGRLKVDYSLTNEELYIVTLAWIDQVCGHVRDEVTGYNPDTYANDYASCLKQSLDIIPSDKDLETIVTSHHDWAWDPTSARLVLHNGREVDCSGSVMQHLLNKNKASIDDKSDT